MIRKLLLILCFTILVNAGILGTDFSPATSVSYSSFSSSPPIIKSIETPIVENTQQVAYERAELSPIYESIYSRREGKHFTQDGSEHRTYSKSLDTGPSKFNKFEERATKGLLSFSAPVYTEAIYQSGSYSQHIMSPTANLLSFPLNRSPLYATQIKPANYVTPETNSPLAYSIGASPLIYNTKVTPGLSAFASSFTGYAPTLIESRSISADQLNSETPAVSHVTFSGTGYNYSW